MFEAFSMWSASQLYTSHPPRGFSQPPIIAWTRPGPTWSSFRDSRPPRNQAALDLCSRIRRVYPEEVAYLVVKRLFSDLSDRSLVLYAYLLSDTSSDSASVSSSFTLKYQDECTMRKIKALHTGGQPSYQILRLKYKKTQSKVLCEDQTYLGTRETCKRQKEHPLLQNHYVIEHGKLESTDDLEDTFSNTDGTNSMMSGRTVFGQLSLKAWKHAAGRGKSWKRPPKSRIPEQMYKRQARRRRNVSENQFAKSPLWVPIVFLRSQAAKKSTGLGHIMWRRDSDPVSKRARRYDRHVYSFEEAPMMAPSRHCNTKFARHTETRVSGTTMIEDSSQEPASAFIRLTWKGKILINGVRRLDRFLPTGLIFGNGWCIAEFLRNESFADVYSLRNAPSSSMNESSQEAHVFLDEYHGNCAVYSRRLRNRMLKKEDCLDSFLYGARQVVIMRIQKRPLKFTLRNTKDEFPILVDQIKCNEKIALQCRPFRGKPSFAAVAGARWPGADSDYQTMPMSQGKSALEKELEKIEKTRVKKAQKQRVKRQVQRDKRITMKLHGVRESLTQSVM